MINVLVFLYLLCALINFAMYFRMAFKEEMEIHVGDILFVSLLCCIPLVGSTALYLIIHRPDQTEAWLNIVLYRPKSRGKGADTKVKAG
jgi:heme/copper-type cytochrome/quinol oxidase subunit 4